VNHLQEYLQVKGESELLPPAFEKALGTAAHVSI
jgi:hypothetical protein